MCELFQVTRAILHLRIRNLNGNMLSHLIILLISSILTRDESMLTDVWCGCLRCCAEASQLAVSDAVPTLNKHEAWRHCNLVGQWRKGINFFTVGTQHPGNYDIIPYNPLWVSGFDRMTPFAVMAAAALGDPDVLDTGAEDEGEGSAATHAEEGPAAGAVPPLPAAGLFDDPGESHAHTVKPRICSDELFGTTGDQDTMDRLRLRQAARDGGKEVPRFERRTYPATETATAVALDHVITDLVECLLIKGRHTQQTEGEVGDTLLKLKSSYTRAGRHDLAALLPDSYKAMLTMLQDSGDECGKRSNIDGAWLTCPCRCRHLQLGKTSAV